MLLSPGRCLHPSRTLPAAVIIFSADDVRKDNTHYKPHNAEPVPPFRRPALRGSLPSFRLPVVLCCSTLQDYQAYKKEREAINNDLRERKDFPYISEESKRKSWRNLRLQSRKYLKR